MEAFCVKDSLYKRFVNSYTIEDFKKQLEGLERFDTKHNLKAFSDDRFVDIIKEISKEVNEKLGGVSESEEKGVTVKFCS